MIDIHCHILPELDDGADSMQTAVMMAAIAADNGTRAIVATPHITWDGSSCEEKLMRIRVRRKRFQEALKEACIPIQCFAGAEVLCVDTEKRKPVYGSFPCIHQTSYALVEFYFDTSVSVMQTHLLRLLDGGIRPIIAHPERYDAIQKQKEFLEIWRDMGCCVQINKGSCRGSFGRKAKKTAEWALESGQVDFLATDAHDVGNRTPNMIDILRTLSDTYGSAYIKRLTQTNPLRMLRNERL